MVQYFNLQDATGGTPTSVPDVAKHIWGRGGSTAATKLL